MITIEEFLSRMPTPQSRQAAQRLMDVAEGNCGFVYRGVTGVSIRYRCSAWPASLSVAWIYPFPGEKGWMKTKDFTFGAGLGTRNFFESLPAHLREVLETWASSALTGMNGSDVSSVGVNAWSITHEEAAANIDVLAERLANVLRELAALPAEGT